ncbi:MAG: glycosyltransferase family 4 protein [Anaerolineales bacterium]|nr:glycosyltransferase family 4 protein [Anaerolineales bacterium]
MRTLHVVHGYPPSMGGTQWLVQNISEGLAARYQDDVTVFTTVAYHMEHFWGQDPQAMPPGIEQVHGVTVRRFPVYTRLGAVRKLAAHAAHRLRLPYNDWLRTIYNGPLIPGLAQAVAQHRADVVFAAAFPHMQMYDALTGAHRADVPIVFLGAIHTADAWGYQRKMMMRAIRQADAYIALTGYERDHLVGQGVQPERIAVIGPGVDAGAFVHADGAALRAQYGWGRDPVVGVIAKHVPRKRFDTLLAAMPRVWAAHPQTRLLIAGARTPYSAQIEEMIDALPAQWRSRVTLVSDFAEADKSALLAACDACVLPSGYESFGIAFLEAWACGKPVVGARIGAIPSVIDEQRDGLLAAYGDAEEFAAAICRLLAQPELRLKLGSAGQRKVLQQHTWEVVTDRVRAVYADAIARHGKDRRTAG